MRQRNSQFFTLGYRRDDFVVHRPSRRSSYVIPRGQLPAFGKMGAKGSAVLEAWLPKTLPYQFGKRVEVLGFRRIPSISSSC
jgi:hypothetical protein